MNCLHNVQSTWKTTIVTSEDETDKGVSVLSVSLKWRPGQVRDLHAILCNYVDHFSSLPFFPLQAPKVTLWFKPSSQAVNRRGTHVCKCQLCPQAGKAIEIYCAQLSFPTHFENSWPHMYSHYWNNESSLTAEAIQVKLQQLMQTPPYAYV